MLSCFEIYLDFERARNVQTYYFSTLHTNLKHEEISMHNSKKISNRSHKYFDRPGAWIDAKLINNIRLKI